MPIESLECPNCGAPLERVSEITRCAFCNSTIHVSLGRDGRLEAALDAAQEEGQPADGTPSLPEKDYTTPPISMEEAAALAAEISGLARGGQKIAAIHLYRERTAEPLTEAKRAVELLQNDPTDPAQLDRLAAGTRPAEEKYSQRPAGGTQEYIRQLARAGQVDEAARLYQNLTGTGLKDAQDVVEFLAADGDAEKQPESTPRPALPADQIRELIVQGKRAEAARLYQDSLGVDAAEAQGAIAAIARGMHVSRFPWQGAALGNALAGLGEYFSQPLHLLLLIVLGTLACIGLTMLLR